MRIALIQMPVLPDKVKNIQTACGKIREAAKNGADFAVLPEMFCCPYDNSCFGAYGEPEGGEAQTALSHLAAELGLYLVGGTVPELSEGRIYNTSYVYGPDGRQLAKHRKAHLFDIDVQGGQRFRESDTLSPGNAITTFETAFGTMGLCVCFDLRFEELARCMCLRGAKVIFVPAAFNMTTGPRPLGTSLPPAGSGQPVLHRGGLPRPGRTGLLRGLRQLHRRGSLGRRALPGRGGGDNPVRGPGRGTAGGGTGPAAHPLRPADGSV